MLTHREMQAILCREYQISAVEANQVLSAFEFTRDEKRSEQVFISVLHELERKGG